MNYRNALDVLQQRLRLRDPAVAVPWDPRAILVGLMVPMGMTVLNLSMFGVALPAIRDSFQIEADTVAWLVTAYTLPFVIFMPLYGRLGDGLGKRRLFSIGIIIFFLGTLLCLVADSISLLLVGRVLQGIGTAGVNPLCIATIAEIFPRPERGRALATWSSTGPATGMIAPFMGGFLVEHFGWQSLFWTGIIAAAAALWVVRGRIPKLAPTPQPGFLRYFDWVGMALLSGTIIFLVAYLSSRALTGVEPLRDWRLALGTLIVGMALIWWERRHPTPLVPLGLFRGGNFTRGSFAAGLRMMLMSSEGFLLPLYLADIYNITGSQLGIVMTLHAGSLLTTVRLGGRLADHRSRRWPVLLGFAGQGAMFLFLALLSSDTPVWIPTLALMVHGGSAGMSLAVLHRIAMDDVPSDLAGAAAGLYSMVRFFGSVIGATLGGVILTQALARSPMMIDAYHFTFLCTAVVGLIAILSVWRVKDAGAAPTT
jgi:EmrB/QacA subfamily drug resistance transporter